LAQVRLPHTGIPLTSLAEHPVLDIAIDGADQVDAHFNAIKGGGAAHTREKVVARSAKRFVIVADDSKTSEQLNHFVPIEVLPYAKNLVIREMKELGGEPQMRLGVRKDGPVLSLELSACTGVVEHGIFTDVDDVYIGQKDGSVTITSSR
jgi:ribose 5-phosphate isomerase A